MQEMTIIDHLIELKLAKHPRHATNVANGLRLYDLKTIEEQVERAKLYRLWRDAGEPSSVAFPNAIEGKKPMELPLKSKRTPEEIINEMYPDRITDEKT